MDDPGAGVCRRVAKELEVLTLQPFLLAFLAVGAGELARIGVDWLGVFQEGDIAAFLIAPAVRVRRDHEVAGVPHVEAAPRIDDDLLAGVRVEEPCHRRFERAEEAAEEPRVIVELGDAERLGVVDPPEESILRLDGVALPGDELPDPVGGALADPGDRGPDRHPVDAIRPRRRVLALGLLDQADDLGLGVQLALRDGQHEVGVGQRQVGRQQRRRRRVGPAGPTAPEGQDEDDQQDGRPLDQCEAEVGEGARGIEWAEGGAQVGRRGEGLEDPRSPRLGRCPGTQGECQQRRREPGRAPRRPRGETVPPQSPQRRDGQRREGQQLAREAELPKAGDEGRQDPVDAAVAVAELAVDPDGAHVVRVVRAEARGEVGRPARRPEAGSHTHPGSPGG